MSARTHQLLNTPEARIHAVVQGSGPLVILVHGFPESWYSWRHQLTALADAGFRAVAIDQRGYGRSSKFWKPEAYRISHLVNDVVGVVQALGEQRAVVVGHDWGAAVAWTAAWLHPEVFRGVVGLSVPFSGRGLIALPGSPFGERQPDRLHAEIAGPGQDFYQDYFGTLDRIVHELESDVRGWLRKAVWSLSGDALSQMPAPPEGLTLVEMMRHSALCIPQGQRMDARFSDTQHLPAWFTESDLNIFTGEFERSGFGGPLSFYRELTASWRSLEAQKDKPLTSPALFIGGAFDVATQWGAEAIARAAERMPAYRGTTILPGCGHWIQQERAEDTNRLLIDFLQELPA